MKLNLISFLAVLLPIKGIAIAFLSLAILFTPWHYAIAGTLKSNPASTAQEAAKEVVQDTGAKKQFGKSERGDQLIDKAKARAQKKLNNLAEQADSPRELPDSKKLFLDNLQGNT